LHFGIAPRVIHHEENTLNASQWAHWHPEAPVQTELVTILHHIQSAEIWNVHIRVFPSSMWPVSVLRIRCMHC